MDPQRISRYVRKIELIKENMNDIQQWSSNLSIDDLLHDKKSRYAIYKAYQEIVEAFMDIIAMMVKDTGLLPEDDYTNIQKLIDHNILQDNHAHVLEIANNTRNWIVHRYNKLDDRFILRRIFQTLQEFTQILKVIEEWLKTKF